MKADTPQDILKGVSRSFYLTLRVLPGRVRPQFSTAYLFCRAADTIADGTLIPHPERMEALKIFRNQFTGGSVSFEAVGKIQNHTASNRGGSNEERLFQKLPDCFRTYLGFTRGDRERIQHLVTTLTGGMEADLERFPARTGGPPVALKNEQELDRYCYLVAGVVGEFWTRMTIAHFPSLKNWNEEEMSLKGVRFGKGLQMTNILKDLSKDLARGRCYLPQTLLEKHGLSPADLVPTLSPGRIRPLLSHFVHLALEHLEDGWKYIVKIPRGELRLRLACFGRTFLR